MSRSRSTVAALAVAVLIGAGVLAGCGDDDDDATTETTEAGAEQASAEPVTLTADEYTFDLSATPTAETESVTFDNQGKEGHALILARINEGFTVDEAVQLEGEKGSAEVYVDGGAGPGQTEEFEITKPLEPGEYAMLCPIPSKDGPHYKLGQLAEFTIE